ncbi:hypothetical protein [Neorhizobium sp. LjRoot104]|uniref:hypothetical protein n=1 Tax=Neorhizobium sp. LjRoot104 TaxID=3342254 RepID=UPI003ECD3646
MIKTLVLLSVMAGATAAHAQFSANDFMAANEAAQIVGGADACKLKLDDKKLDAFMKGTVAKLDPTALMHFSNARPIQQQIIRDMSDTERRAHCSLLTGLAEKRGLTP